LSVSLGVVGSGQLDLSTEGPVEGLPKGRDELGPSVGHYRV